jgi:hypothetical protein
VSTESAWFYAIPHNFIKLPFISTVITQQVCTSCVSIPWDDQSNLAELNLCSMALILFSKESSISFAIVAMVSKIYMVHISSKVTSLHSFYKYFNKLVGCYWDPGVLSLFKCLTATYQVCMSPEMVLIPQLLHLHLLVAAPDSYMQAIVV